VVHISTADAAGSGNISQCGARLGRLEHLPQTLDLKLLSGRGMIGRPVASWDQNLKSVMCAGGNCPGNVRPIHRQRKALQRPPAPPPYRSGRNCRTRAIVPQAHQPHSQTTRNPLYSENRISLVTTGNSSANAWAISIRSKGSL
jgi:hypothetical protein